MCFPEYHFALFKKGIVTHIFVNQSQRSPAIQATRRDAEAPWLQQMLFLNASPCPAMMLYPPTLLGFAAVLLLTISLKLTLVGKQGGKSISSYFYFFHRNMEKIKKTIENWMIKRSFWRVQRV